MIKHWKIARLGEGVGSPLLFLLVILILQVVGGQGPAPDGEGAAPLISRPSKVRVCADDPTPGYTYGKIKLANLHPEISFLSQKPREPTDITIVTQCSLDRLFMLESQCDSWTGVTSAAVYMSLVQYKPNNTNLVKSAGKKIQRFHQKMERESQCRMDIVLVSETLKPADLWAYPYNALRNQALARATTDVVFLVDVDFMISSGLQERLKEPEASAALLRSVTTGRSAIVVPAFETDPKLSLVEGSDIAKRTRSSSKEDLHRLFELKQVIQFAEFYPPGHKASNYPLWFASDTPYPISFKVGYEPYLLVSRRHIPWYDERFRGYGWDKVSQIWHIDAMAFRFVGHPNAFVIHRPHAPSSGYNHTFTGKAYSKHHRPTEHLYKMERIAKDLMQEVQGGTYPDEGVTALSQCRLVVEGLNKDANDAWW